MVLGLVTTKTPELESLDNLQRRVEDAGRYFPVENMCVSTQCGFASQVIGNPITHDQQEKKLSLVVDTARKVWGST